MAEVYVRERDDKGRFVEADSPLADKAYAIKLYKDVDDYLRSLPREERTEFVRELIAKAVREKKKNEIAAL
jgi:hypothetical protein